MGFQGKGIYRAFMLFLTALPAHFPLKEDVLKKLTIAGFAVLFSLMATKAASQGTKKMNSLAEAYRSGTIRFVPVATVDETKLPKDVYFQGPVDVKCDPDGNVYVCDYKANSVLKFDSDGNFLKTIGRKGQGPGDFNMPFNIAVTKDRLYVWEMGNRRISALALDGTYQKSVHVEMMEGSPQAMKSLPNGSVLLGWEMMDFQNFDKPQIYSLRIMSPDLIFEKTVYQRNIWQNKYARLEGRFTNIPQPFSPFVSWDVTPDGKIIVSDQKTYEIEIHDPIKGRLSSFKHDQEPVKITEKDKEIFFAGMVSSVTYDGKTPSQMKKGAPDYIVKATSFPEAKPPFFNLMSDAEGNILVFPYQTDRSAEGKAFDAFSPEGQFLGFVKIEEMKFRLTKAAPWREGFWTFSYDEDGIPGLVKYRIEGIK